MFSPAITLTRFENTLIRSWSVLILSVSFLENSYENKYFAKALWSVKLSVQYDQSERKHSGSIDEHASQEFNSVANALVRFGLLTHCIYSGSQTLWNQSQFNEHRSEKKTKQQQQTHLLDQTLLNPTESQYAKARRKQKDSEGTHVRQVQTFDWLITVTTWSPKSNTSFH